MCGIAGILRVTPPEAGAAALARDPREAIPEAWLDILDESIKYRGPDGQGRFRDRAVRADGTVVDVALVHRRLSILDHAGGAQPMVSERGREGRNEGLVAVVFNGCIYNHRELRKELQAAGHEFVTDHSDTEVLVHGWREWGEGLLDRLEGMYGIAIWDARAGELVVARDPFGEKPLYVLGPQSVDGAALVSFASVVPGLARLQRATGAAVHDWARHKPFLSAWIQFGWNQGDVLPGIREVLPEMGARFPSASGGKSGGMHCLARTDGLWGRVLQPRRAQLSAGEVDAALRAAVHARLEADVPLGCFLSGGIDSSLVARYAVEARPDIAAFTVRMPSPDLDESRAAARSASAIGVRHEILDCDARPAEDLLAIITQIGMPFGDSSLLPALWVSRATRSVARVALTGDGGDELFLGYERHRAIRPLALLGRCPRSVLRPVAAAFPHGGGARSLAGRLSRFLDAAAHSGYKDLIAIFPSPLDWRLGLSPKGNHGSRSIHHWGMAPRGGKMFSNEDLARLALRFDLLFYLPEDLMRKADSASMSVALEVRAPFLDTRVAREAIGATVSSLMPHGQRKGLLRQVARKYLPAEIVDRPKMGFAIPIGEWFRSDFGGMRTLLMDRLNSREPFGADSLGIGPMINMGFVRQMLKEHDAVGERSLWPWKGRDHSQRLYMLLVLSIWADWMGKVARGGS